MPPRSTRVKRPRTWRRKLMLWHMARGSGHIVEALTTTGFLSGLAGGLSLCQAVGTLVVALPASTAPGETVLRRPSGAAECACGDGR
jgi:hypothetical protein